MLIPQFPNPKLWGNRCFKSSPIFANKVCFFYNTKHSHSLVLLYNNQSLQILMNDQEQPVVDHPGRSDGSLGSEGGESGNVRSHPHPRPPHHHLNHHHHHQDATHLWHGHLWHENHATDVWYCHFSGHLWHAHPQR